MATYEEIVSQGEEITLQTGKRYLLPRPWLGYWRKADAFVRACADYQKQDNPPVDEFIDLFVEFLVGWLNTPRNAELGLPDVTKEQIETEFDLTDLPEIMRVLVMYREQIGGILPPSTAPSKPKAKRTKKKPA